MKIKDLLMLAGGSAALILSASADAAYTHLYLEHSDAFFNNHPNEAVKAAWLAGPVNQYDIYRLYANFTSNTPADRVNAVAGTPDSPFQVAVVGGSFYNFDDGHGPFNLPSPLPNRAWDTWVTIGDAINGGSTDLAPGFSEQTNGLGGNSSMIGPADWAAWFVVPADPQGQAVASVPGQANAPPGTYRVLLAQFTVTQGTANVVGNALVNVNGESLLNQTFAIPTPGALALMVLAGFVGARRRRG